MLTLCLVFGLAAPPATPLPSQIAGLIKQLGDDDFERREEASRRLRDAGEIAEPALEKAADSDDAEVRKRARAILADFKLGIYPGVPAAVVDLVRKYATLTGPEKRPVIQALLAAGGPGVRAMVRLARGEADAVARKEVFAGIAAGVARVAPALLEAEDRPALEALLELCVLGDVESGAGHYAAYWLLTGKIDTRIAALEARARADAPGKKENEVLFWLYRARGDLKKARDAALKAERAEFVEAALMEAGDWKTLDKDPALAPTGDRAMQQAFRATYARLAGNTKAYEKIVAELIEQARPIARERGNVLTHAKGLFFNVRAEQAVELLTLSKAEPRMLFNVLAARMRFKEAFALAEEARAAKGPDAMLLTVQEARTRFLLGQKDEALALVKKAALELKPGQEEWPAELIETEIVMGRRDEAFAHTASLMTFDAMSDWAARLFDKLFRPNDKEARMAWAVIKEMPGTKAEQLALLRKLFEGKGDADDIRAVMKATEVPGEAPAANWLGVGEAALLCKQEKLAADCFARAGVRGEVRLGDLLAKKKRHADAAERYLSAYKAAVKAGTREPDADDAIPSVALYLSGRALIDAGKKAEGKARVERAHLLTLGDMEARYGVMRALRKRGEREGMLREATLLARLGDPLMNGPGNYWTAEGIRALAIEQERSKQELKAADNFELVFLGCLTPGMTFTRPQAYATVPSYMHKVRAVGLARAGRYDEALAVAGYALSTWPANLDVAIGVVPVLEKGGKKAEAAKLYRMVQGPAEAFLKEYPKSPLALNQLAWLAAACRRDTDKAVAWAGRAVALAPGTAAYHDTHAEALFQAGMKKEALAAIKKALALSPNRTYFKNQLKRIEKGDRAAPLPSEDEEDDDED